MDILILLVILVAATVLYMTRWLPTEITALLTIASLALSGILTTDQALSGFASTAMLTVAAMFVLSGGLLRTGALEAVTIGLARFAQGDIYRLLVLLAIVIPLASAFMNNTPVVVMMVPVMLSLSDHFGVRPSKLLIPLSYFAVLGGTLTLLGTSTNILVDDLYRRAGGPGFGLFDFTSLGLIFTAVCGGFIVLLSQRFLPNRAPLATLSSARHGRTRFITEVIADAKSQLVGKPVRELFGGPPRYAPPQPRTSGGHRRVGRQPAAESDPEQAEDKVELLELFRYQRIYRGEEGEGLVIQDGDALLISGTPQAIARFLETTGARLASALADTERRPLTSSLDERVVEAVVLPESPATGRQIVTLGLHQRYGVKVLGLQRRGGHRRVGLRRTRLQSGDVLLLQGRPERIHRASEALRLLVIEGVEGSLVRKAKNRIALLIMAGVVLLAAFTGLPIVILALAGAALMVVTNCLRPEEAWRSLDASTLMLLAGTIPLGVAMETTGLAELAVHRLLDLAGSAPPVVFLSIFYLLTSLLTQILSNNAVAVLMTPIALSLAGQLGIHPQPLLMAIAFGASASFMTPMGYQTNAIVMGPGGYTFADYLRMGIPLQLLTWILATICIPLIWPL